MRALQITTYICPTCNASKEIRDDLTKNGNQQLSSVPDSVPCGFRGCTDMAINTEFKPRRIK